MEKNKGSDFYNKYWKKEYILNLEIIDQQHAHFFDICQELTELIDNSVKVDDNTTLLKTFKILSELRSYVFFHFHTEEQYMLNLKYKNIFEHISCHDSLINDVVKFKNRFFLIYKDFDITREADHNQLEVFNNDLLTFLSSWVINHIINEDKKFFSEK